MNAKHIHDEEDVRSTIAKSRAVTGQTYPKAGELFDLTRGMHKRLSALLQRATVRRAEYAENALMWLRWDAALASAWRSYESTALPQPGGGLVAARRQLIDVTDAVERLLNMCNAVDDDDPARRVSTAHSGVRKAEAEPDRA